MTDFQRGDQIRVGLAGTDQSRTIWVAEDDETGELFTYHGLDPFAPQVPLTELLSDDTLVVTLEKPFSEALPSVPGEYEDRFREESKLAILEINADYEFDGPSRTPWVLTDEGSWIAPNGETRPAEDNWLLAVNGFDFFPWSEAAVK